MGVKVRSVETMIRTVWEVWGNIEGHFIQRSGGGIRGPSALEGCELELESRTLCPEEALGPRV